MVELPEGVIEKEKQKIKNCKTLNEFKIISI